MALQMHVIQTNEIQKSEAISGELLEKVIIGNDLSGLNAVEKVQYIKSICATLGLNPLTKPIQLMKFQGKEIPYLTKDATEQLRKINKISINKIETQIKHVKDGEIYIVTAYATTLDGRQDSSTAAIVVSGVKGEALANLFMKAETKAKRRVTLSICGLGFIDECEVESIPNAKKIDIESAEVKQILFEKEVPLLQRAVESIKIAKDLEELRNIYVRNVQEFRAKSINIDIIKAAKDKRKEELLVNEFSKEYDSETGEVVS